MVLEAVYNPANNSWVIRDMTSGTVIFEYSLDDVPLGYVIGTAVVNGMLDKSAFQEYISTGRIQEDKLNEILVWFSEHYYPTAAMGRSLLQDIRELISIYLSTMKTDKKASNIWDECVRTLSERRLSEFLESIGG